MIIYVVMIALLKIVLDRMLTHQIKPLIINGQLQRYAGYPVGCTSQTVDNIAL
jgi:hypothetical protein